MMERVEDALRPVDLRALCLPVMGDFLPKNAISCDCVGM